MTRLLRALGALGLLTSLLPTIPGVAARHGTTAVEQWPLHNDGLNDVVQWDHYSIEVNGKRLYVFAGEWHYWRIPVPEMWEDILQKIKAAGFTAFTFYANWAYHAPNATTLDFTTGAHDFTPLFTIAKKLGLYVLIRPGPYVNAEANAGGFPLWLTTGAYGALRNNDSRYTDAWTPYFSEMAKISSDYLVTKGENGLLFQIENEYGDQWIGTPTNRVPNPTATAYMESLEASARENGIDVPLSFNNPNLNSLSWIEEFAPNAGGNVDINGVDSYPSCWTCDLSQCASTNGPYVAYQVVDYYDYFQDYQPSSPSFMPEFQGGSFNPWGGPEGGCPGDIGADFANLFYRHNIAAGVTAMSLYMLYGGTNWGSLAAPVVATSYDYASPISEDRSIGSKYYETKLLALFTRSADDLTKTDRIANSTSLTTNPNVLATELRNPDTNGAFYVTIHATSSSDTLEAFQLFVNTSAGALTVPQNVSSVILNGHQSKIIVTDFTFGSGTLLYSTAEVLTYAIFDGTPTLVLWVPTGESGEFSVIGAKKGHVMGQKKASKVTFTPAESGLIVALTNVNGMTVIALNTGIKVIVLDRAAAYNFWAPSLTADPFAPENETILVSGPYLVRGASVDGCTVSLTGDIANATSLDVFAPAEITEVTWNGKSVPVTKSARGSLTAYLPSPYTDSVVLPALTSWKVHDSLLERKVNYDDTGIAWVDADHMTTSNPTPPATLPVLYMDDYGFHNGISLYRGYFNGTASGVTLSVQGGTAFGWSAWLNNIHIGSFLGSPNLETGTLYLSFDNATLRPHSPNLLFLMQDNTGHDETSGALNPRGILSAALSSSSNSSFSSWKICGTAGGDAVQLDPVRGALAEGGLRAERLGWHLPGFDDSEWATGDPSTGFSGAGVNFYRTVVPVSIPTGLDVSLSFVLSAPASQSIRVQLFVNGYQYGRFNPWIGHQVVFPVPPGVLDYNGENVIGLAVWNQGDEGVAEVGVEWKVEYIVESGFDVGFDGGYLRPGWTKVREEYK